jgi:hypothetical protein
LHRCAVRRKRDVSEEIVFHFQYRKYAKQETFKKQAASRALLQTLKMKAICSSETSGFPELYGVTTQYIVTALRTSDPTDRVFEKRELRRIFRPGI